MRNVLTAEISCVIPMTRSTEIVPSRGLSGSAEEVAAFQTRNQEQFLRYPADGDGFTGGSLRAGGVVSSSAA